MATANESLFRILFGLSHQNFLLDGLFVFLGQYLPYFMVLLALGWIYSFGSKRERWFVFFELALILILSRGIITESFQFFYKHLRPMDVLGVDALLAEGGNSFPSGHASFMFALSGGLLMYSWRWGFTYLTLSLVNGIARIVAGVHWPLDILGGIVVGLLSAALIHFLLGKHYPSEKQAEEPPGIT
ncbi:MAG: phosphatase PAP2 family protein [Candidatus Liptonbacteria bacterium]